MGKPGIILTSQFTTPKAQSFSNYVQYMIRKEALLDKKNDLTSKEKEELFKITNVIDKYDMEKGKSYLSFDRKNQLKNDMEVEAIHLLKEKDYTKYISYMSRQYALENKNILSEVEEKELRIVKSHLKEIAIPTEDNKEDKKKKVKPGVFSINKTEMTNEDLDSVNQIINKAQNNGSVFYQDVISFDTDFLIKEKLLNPETKELNEDRIQAASRKMMDQMFKDEKIESGFWFASIHRNTEHVHIHFGTVETKNTRPIIAVEEEGRTYFVPKGKRKQQTIDNMKSTFANSLIDRTSELTRISNLRNTLVQDIKELYEDKSLKEKKKLLEEIYEELPANLKYWQYGSKHISENTRRKIDQITTDLVKDNPNYQEYILKTEEESEYRKSLFGDSERNDKDYAANKKKDIQKRLGNALLTEMKNNVIRQNNARKLYMNSNQKEDDFKKDYVPYQRQKKFKTPVFSKKNLYYLRKAINDDLEKYRAERDYEQLQERIAREQQMNRI